MNTVPESRPAGTALITGATGGIGRELAELFVRDGYRTVLVARRESELAAIAGDWKARYGATVETVALDLADHGAACRLVEELRRREIDVDIVVNNAGFAQFGAFAEADVDQLIGMLELNIVTLTHLTRLLLPGMLERGWGRVLNVASTAAFMPGPLMAAYYASKAYVLSFSEGLNEELRGTGVSATALCPGPTRTGFQERAAKYKNTAPGWPKAQCSYTSPPKKRSDWRLPGRCCWTGSILWQLRSTGWLRRPTHGQLQT